MQAQVTGIELDAAQQASPTIQSKSARRAIMAAGLGHMLEWYEFTIYGYMALTISRKFFPANETTSLLLTFATFGLGFVARPLGGIVLGRLGDLWGRKPVMLVTFFIMALSTLAMGLLPTFETVGIAAPVMLVLVRLLQGFSLGGEWAVAAAFMVEWAPDRKRGLYGSFNQLSASVGILLGSFTAAAINSLVDAATIDAGAWRIPFLLGIVLLPVGFYVRRSVGETPAFEASRSVPKPAAAASGSFTRALQVLGLASAWSVEFYIFLSYLPSFSQRQLGMSASTALWANTAGLIVYTLCLPVTGHLSDRFGRRIVLAVGCMAFAALTYPLFFFMLSGIGVWTLVAIQILFGVSLAAISGPATAALTEIFPTHNRSSWLSAVYSIAVALAGGFAPFVATWLISLTGHAIAPTFYVIGASLLGLLTIATMRETAHERLS
ncbi:MFS transporter [Mesorhizobium comanense]|uniref:MFS transporter n=1 Tax=Mesorhizobium comanense TaxID=2502215 RepID=UPI0014854093|nr:MFS transporter [Mesorhizobium comanense]